VQALCFEKHGKQSRCSIAKLNYAGGIKLSLRKPASLAARGKVCSSKPRN